MSKSTEQLSYSVLKEDTYLKCDICGGKADSISSHTDKPICMDCLFDDKDLEQESVKELNIKKDNKEKLMSKNNKVTTKCEECGKDFENSKFTPYIKKCKDCKKPKKAEAKPTKKPVKKPTPKVEAPVVMADDDVDNLEEVASPSEDDV